MGKDKKAKKGAAVKKPSLRPPYVDHRLAVWEKCKIAHEKEIEQKKAKKQAIKVTLPDGGVKEGIAFETTPYDIAFGIAEGLARSAVVAKANGEYHDLMRPLEEDCNLELFKFDSEEGKHCFWHSSAHIMGQAMELIYGGSLGIGPALESGFYYDMYMENGAISTDDYESIDAAVNGIIKAAQPFERICLSKAQALELFKFNKFKVELISNDIPDDAVVSAYRCGPLIDLCRGPHVNNTKQIKAFSVMKNSSAFWKGKSENDVLQRVYGVSFPDKKALKQHKLFLEEAAKRDHRKIGIDQQLFFFDPISPGSCFFLPHGARIYNALIDFIKAIYRRRGYEEVVTPNVFNVKLWQTSGHWQNYAKNMFKFECENDLYALKPMNCPGHCVLFAHTTRSHKELPMRLADFGVLHRNELSGTLSGLTRVRRFQQDDAHIFCREAQIQEEIGGVLAFLQEVYGIFGFTFELLLSTRPEKYLGDVATWDSAEMALARALSEFGHPWGINPADGAFYGPKIDITVCDALNRKHQCATIQLDFQLPQRFGLQYQDENGLERPVIIHRAILGSVERMIAILTESCAGKWPFWLSPRQVKVIPVSPDWYEYAEQVVARLHTEGFHTEGDYGPNTFPKKIAVAQSEQFNYMLICGKDEAAASSINVRLRGEKKERGMITVDEVVAEFKNNCEKFQN